MLSQARLTFRRSTSLVGAKSGIARSFCVPSRLLHSDTPKTTSCTLPSGKVASFSNILLRENCKCPECYHPVTRQRLVDTFVLPRDLKPQEIESTSEGITITWPGSLSLESHKSLFPWDYLEYLRSQLYEPSPVKEHVFWDASIASRTPTVDYNELMRNAEEGERAVWEWLKQIDVYGFSFISNVPHNPEDTEALLRRIAFIRGTHYSEGFWDFEGNFEHGDLAYSNVYLRAHTDTTYFTDSAGLQLFHLLSPRSTHKGGNNLLVDGFSCASKLKTTHPEHYDILSSVPVRARAAGTSASGFQVDVRPLVDVPAFEHNGEGLIRVRWNGDDRRLIKANSANDQERWYDAAFEYEKLLRDPANELWTEMQPGTAIIFDNHRVLHGRSEYTGKRRLCGGYINSDDFRGRLRTLERKFRPQTTSEPNYWDD